MLVVFGQHKSVDGHILGAYPLTVVFDFGAAIIGFNRMCVQVKYHGLPRFRRRKLPQGSGMCKAIRRKYGTVSVAWAFKIGV